MLGLESGGGLASVRTKFNLGLNNLWDKPKKEGGVKKLSRNIDLRGKG